MRKSLFLLFAVFAMTASAQTNEPIKLNLVSPLDYQVFQRQTASNGAIIVESILDTKARSLTNLDKLEARLTDASTNGSLSSQWRSLPFDNRVRRFRAELPAPAGG